MTQEEVLSKYPQLSWLYDPAQAGRDYSFWGMGANVGTKFTYPKMYEAIENIYGSFDAAPKPLIGLLQDKVGYGASVADYEKQLNAYKNNESQYYKDAIAKDASVSGWNSAQVAFAGGTPQGLENPQLVQEAISKGYLNADQAKSIVEPAFNANYSAGTGQYNNDLTGGGGLINQVLGGITSNPISTLAFPIVGAAALGAFSAPAIAGTDYLGSQALGSAETGAVGTGSTGFGINAGASGAGFNAGTGSLLAAAPTESGFGISVTPPAGSFGELSPYIGSGTSGASGFGIDTGLATEGYLGAGSATDAAAKSGLGYLGGANALPTGTAGISTNVSASDSILNKTKRLSDLLKGGQQQQQQGGNTATLLAKGLTDGQQDTRIGYNMNQNPFQFTTQLPIQTQATPQTDLSKKTESLDLNKINQNLASLLRNQ